ncbi:MAG: FAD:protein FMN transferase [Planctomycetota bacterium]
MSRPVLRAAFVVLALGLAACGAPVEGGGDADRIDAAPPNGGPTFESGIGATLHPTTALDARTEVRVEVTDRRDDGRLMLERTGAVMGTSMRLAAIGRDRAALEVALEAAEAELRRVEDLMTDWRPSPLMDLNAAAGSGPVATDVEIARLLERALLVSRLTGGAFDPTWRGVGRLWNFKAVEPVLPDPDDVARGLALVDFRRVVVAIDESAGTATVEMPAGFELGLGGIAKGYGVDRAMAVLVEHGVEDAVVDAGGDLKVLGRHFDESWRVAIRHPRRRGDVMAVLPVSNTCVVTSGDYERFFEIDGVRYHHIVDPRTGRPSTGCMSATVVGPDAAVCDALATALCVMGPEQGLPLIERSGTYQAVVVGLDGEVRRSAGLVEAPVGSAGAIPAAAER